MIGPGINGNRSNHPIQRPQPTTTTVDHESNPEVEMLDISQHNLQGMSVIPKPLHTTTSDCLLVFYLLFCYMNSR